MNKWRLLRTEPANAYYNMAVDEAILRLHSQEKVPPTLRFYSWNPAALSLGYFQKFNAEVDREACQKEGIDIVRRLTGGRAILHDQELTYSLTIREDYGLLSDSIINSYKEISEGLVAGLNKLDIPAQLKARERGKKAPSGNSAACFDTPSWYEVILNKKKLIGSAQTRKEDTVLQHGSLPYEIDPIKTFSLFKYDDDKNRKKARRLFSASSTSLKEVAHDISKKELEDALAEGISERFDIIIEENNLTDEEKELAETLMKDKYSQDSWNKKR